MALPPDKISQESNVSMLEQCDTVFLCVDGGPVKKLVLEVCVHNDILLIDCGMGVHRTTNGGPLMGSIRVTTCRPDYSDHSSHTIDQAGEQVPGEYERNAQMAELNALNAALAVIKWKKFRGIYNDLAHEHDYVA